ncbi:MvaI/BcnI restriction endonuclease family protein [Nitrosomonas nitrosa]|uniref:MvaI/BcnI restriction endonuclease family protein n=1 Tax=Nitrosomonas nitrosa TaxID=52442 RepID=A0A1I4PFS5_9PROT|nr:MvaI/BcnI family restriction endonuclease [Nitrosomonas nitrosa]SFM26624.1 MvaI/BcnI restriction endonuclease family protein [Nitrosomonas nitrosa]
MTISYTKDSLIETLKQIRALGWIENRRHGNDGGIGNTLEDLLGIDENNLPIPNAAEWELKCQRSRTASLTTLLHREPSPLGMRLVPRLLLPKYGWRHEKAGSKYPDTEMSFRQTINAVSRTDRGFGIRADHNERKVIVSFDASKVNSRHNDWLNQVKQKVSLDELNPQPYWGFDDLFHAIGSKLHNCFYIKADTKKESGKEYFHYTDIMMLQKFSLEKFIIAIEQGNILVDFDARTGHNHGTKFRLRQDCMPDLYETVKKF